MTAYVEPGGSWRPFWLVAAALVLFVVLDLVLPGPDVPPLLWAVSLLAVLGTVAAGALSAGRVWTVRVGQGMVTVAPEHDRTADAHLDGDTTQLLLRLWGRPADVSVAGDPAAEMLLRGR